MSEDRSGSSRYHALWQKLFKFLPGEPRDREQLIQILRSAQEHNLHDADAEAMIEGVLQVSEMQAREIMIPRSQVVVVARDATAEEILPVILESGHSRFPVIGESRDEIEGILLAKDLLRYSNPLGATKFSVRDLLRPAVFVPESKRLNVLLKEFRSSRNHMAVVVDEYGGVAGVVTIEDVLEQIVGEIEDEHDFEEEDAYIRKHAENHFTIKALTSVEDFNEYFGTAIDDEDFDTVGGMVINRLGHLPKRGESVTVENMSFQVLKADNRRIHLLQMTVLPSAKDEPALQAD